MSTADVTVVYKCRAQKFTCSFKQSVMTRSGSDQMFVHHNQFNSVMASAEHTTLFNLTGTKGLCNLFGMFKYVIVTRVHCDNGYIHALNVGS